MYIIFVSVLSQLKEYDVIGKDKKSTMEMIVHVSDISNPVKPWDIYY